MKNERKAVKSRDSAVISRNDAGESPDRGGRRKRVGKKRKASIVEAVNSGMSYREVAEKFGVSLGTVANCRSTRIKKPALKGRGRPPVHCHLDTMTRQFLVEIAKLSRFDAERIIGLFGYVFPGLAGKNEKERVNIRRTVKKMLKEAGLGEYVSSGRDKSGTWRVHAIRITWCRGNSCEYLLTIMDSYTGFIYGKVLTRLTVPSLIAGLKLFALHAQVPCNRIIFTCCQKKGQGNDTAGSRKISNIVRVDAVTLRAKMRKVIEKNDKFLDLLDSESGVRLATGKPVPFQTDKIVLTCKFKDRNSLNDRLIKAVNAHNLTVRGDDEMESPVNEVITMLSGSGNKADAQSIKARAKFKSSRKIMQGIRQSPGP